MSPRAALTQAIGWSPLLALAVAAHASADVSGLQFRLTDVAAEIVVISDSELGTPRVRTQQGEVKLWFPDVRDNSRITASGDGRSVLRARLRPGQGTSAVLDIDVGGRRKVEADQVTVERQTGATVVRIARAALVEPAVTSAPKTKPSAATALAPTPVVPAAPGVATEVVQRASMPLGTKPVKAPSTQAKANMLASGGESKLPLLLWMTFGLAIVLGAIKLWQRKTTSLLREPDIEVVAHKRIAPGLQLFIVRAFGQEHLLSVNGKTTERIATNESFDDLESLGAESRNGGFKLPNDPGMALIPSRSVLSTSAEPTRTIARGDHPKVDLPLPAPRTPLTASQSIAGLIRLREQHDRVN